jgi:prevent-host-death family protein
VCYCVSVATATVGLRELRQQASELVRRVESGERLLVTVSGRPAAMLGPVDGPSWRTWDEIAPLFRHPGAGAGWDAERELLDDAPQDPWVER